MDVMAHDFAREGIRNQAEIGRALVRRQICNVCHPELFRRVRYDLLRTCFQQVGMAAKAVMTLRGFMISPLAGNQLSIGSQEIK